MNRIFSLLALVLLAAAPLATQAHSQGTLRVDGSIDGRMVPRMEIVDARHALLSRSGTAALLLSDDELLVQLTDRGIQRISRELDADLSREQGVFAQLVGEVVRGSLNVVFRRAIALPLEEIRDVRYRDGRLEIVSRDGGMVLDGMEIDGEELMGSFRAHEARAFAAALRNATR